MKKIRYLVIFTTIGLVIFIGESMYELFKIEESGTVTTILGLRISTSMTKEELYNQFTLTSKVIYFYILFIIVCSVLFYILGWVKRRILKNES